MCDYFFITSYYLFNCFYKYLTVTCRIRFKALFMFAGYFDIQLCELQTCQVWRLFVSKMG